MVSESFLLVRAFGLTQIHDGGGVDGEDIIVHRVPLTDVATFVAQKREQGYAIDVRIMMLPGLIDFSD
jgi:ADP-ribose pyrophosphatase